MSLSIKINLTALTVLALMYAPQAYGKTFNFNNETYNFTPVISYTTDAGLRVSSLENLSKQILLGYKPSPAALLDANTLTEVEAAASSINQPARSAKFIVQDQWVKEFDPGQNGQSLDIFALYQSLTNLSPEDERLPVLVALPPTKLSETNSLGIKELVAVGESNFAGSSKNRTNNIRVGSERFKGLLMKPGEEFSFNKFLGNVDAANGFLPELVIKKTGLVPEVGGGLCQVSTTAFRAAMNAGLPILGRRNHSFAVRYYAPQGTDATIYPGSTDFRFTNNLLSHLLIITRTENGKLFFDFYGTKDDRKVTFDGPYQYDKKTDGSMKAVWTRIVSYNETEEKQTFRSTYLPPALFQQTSTIESNIPNPTSNSNSNEVPTNQTSQ